MGLASTHDQVRAGVRGLGFWFGLGLGLLGLGLGWQATRIDQAVRGDRGGRKLPTNTNANVFTHSLTRTHTQLHPCGAAASDGVGGLGRKHNPGSGHP